MGCRICIENDEMHSYHRTASFPLFGSHLATHRLHLQQEDWPRSHSEGCISGAQRRALGAFSIDDLRRQLSCVLATQSDDHVRATTTPLPLIEANSCTDELTSGQLDGNSSTTLLHEGNSSKKRVSFADDFGQQLACVRVMSEPSDVPPILTSPQALALIQVAQNASNDCNGGNSTSPQQSGDLWCLDFSQPASDYLKFRQTLEKLNVALENVMLKPGKLTGTVKVKNIAFNKQVFLRYSFDDWATFSDVACEYVLPVGRKTPSSHSALDTFQFSVEMPPSRAPPQKFVEFCVGFRADDSEFWDNGPQGRNYRLTNSSAAKDPSPLVADGSVPCESPPANQRRKLSSDAFELNMENWSEFSTFRHLDSQEPYW